MSSNIPDSDPVYKRFVIAVQAQEDVAEGNGKTAITYLVVGIKYLSDQLK